MGVKKGSKVMFWVGRGKFTGVVESIDHEEGTASVRRDGSLGGSVKRKLERLVPLVK